MGESGAGSKQLKQLRINSAKRIEPPPSITPAAKEVWAEIVNSLPANYFVDSDISLLHTYCEAYINVMTAQEMLKTVPWVFIDGKGMEQKTKWFDILKNQQSIIGILCTKLRLAPSSRIDETNKNPTIKPISKRGDLLG